MLFLLILGLNSEKKLVILFFFFLTGSDSSNSFPSSSQFPSVITLEFAASGGEFAFELQRKWFNDEDSVMNL